MEQFEVELVGGPFPGPRRLRTPRAEPPHQIPIVQKGPATSTDPPSRPRDERPTPRVAVYRYSCRRPDGLYVYQFVGERGRRGHS